MSSASTTMSEWISTRHIQHIVVRGEAQGYDMDALLSDAGLQRSQLADADGQVPVAALETMLAAISRQAPEPLIGLALAKDIQPATFGAIGYIAQSCAQFSDVLDVITRYSGLLSNIGETAVLHGPGTVSIRWRCKFGGALFRQHATDYVLGSFVVLSRLLMAEQKTLLKSVHFTHASPTDPSTLRHYLSFFQCPVHFNAPYAQVVMPAAVLQIRMQHGDAFMKDILERHAQHILQQRVDNTTVADQVRHLIGALIVDNIPDKAKVADQLGISSRSLHRKLQEQGTSYREILDQVRLALAHNSLEEGQVSLSDIADNLGFSTRQAFIRWFKDTSGITPGNYRKQSPCP